MISGSDDSREHFAPNPGKIDIDGVEWFQTDGTYDWYRWSDGSVVIKSQPLFPPEGSTNHPSIATIQEILRPLIERGVTFPAIREAWIKAGGSLE